MPLLSWEDYLKGGRAPIEPPEALEEEVLTEEDPVVQKLNSATAEQLQSVKGIGPKIAQKIVENAPYKDLTDFGERADLFPKRRERLMEWLGKSD